MPKINGTTINHRTIWLVLVLSFAKGATLGEVALDGSLEALGALLSVALELRVDESRCLVEHALERALEGTSTEAFPDLTWRRLWLTGARRAR